MGNTSDRRSLLKWQVVLLCIALLAQSARALLPGPIGGNLWVAQGGAPIWNGNGGENSGAINCVLMHPTNPNIMFVGAVNGGIWRTTNGMESSPTWTPLSDYAPSLSMASLAYDPTDPTYNTLLAGLSSYSSLGASGSSIHGLLRSTDGGNTWTYLDGGGLLTDKPISGAAERGSIVLVSVSWAGSFMPSTLGIYRSSDSGATFTEVSTLTGQPNGLPCGRVRALIGDPNMGSTLYTMIFSQPSIQIGATNVGIYKSTDTGATWFKISNTNIDGLLATDEAYGAAMCAGPSGIVCVGIPDHYNNGIVRIFRSVDGGTTWANLGLAQTSDGRNLVSSGSGIITVYADPVNINVLYAAGSANLRCDLSQPVGSQWARLDGCISGSPPNSGTVNCSGPHEDSRSMTLDLNGNLILVCDGGIFRRTSRQNYLGAWSSINGNLQVGEYHDIAYDPLFQVCVAGTQDCGTQRQVGPGQKLWSQVWCCDGHDVAVDTTTMPGFSIVYASYGFPGGFAQLIYNSSLGLVTNFSCALTVTNGAAIQGQFIDPMRINPVNHRRLIIAAANSIYESYDQGTTISEIGPGLHVGNHGSGAGLAYGGYMGSMANPDILYAAADTGVFVRTNASGNLTLTSSNFPGGSPIDVAMSPTNWNTVYVLSASGIYMSTNIGTSWTNITGNLNGVGTLHCVKTGPTNHAESLLVGTDLGMYVSSLPNFGFWSKVGNNLPNAPVYDLDYNQTADVLVAGLLGRGAWMITNASAMVFAQAPPSIGTQPQSQSILVDASANFTVAVGGTPPFTYQWRKNGSAIVGATNTSITLGLAQSGDAGGYDVVVRNSLNTVTSLVATLTVIGSTSTNCAVAAPAGLISWWTGDGTANDRVGIYNGTPLNGVSYTAGKVGQAFNLNGLNGTIDFGNQIGNFGTNDFTVEFWIKTSSTRQECILSKRPICGGCSFWNIFINAGYVQVEWDQDAVGNNYLNFTGSKKINDGLFHHVAVIRTNASALVYCDGALAGTQTTTGITSLSNSSPCQISYSPCLGFSGLSLFTGLLDEIRIYTRALSLSEIQAMYAAGTNGMCPPTPLMFTAPLSYSKSKGFVLNASLRSSQNYRIQANTNLATTNWLTLTNFTAGTAPVFHFTNNTATNYPQRFYRMVSP